MDRHVMELTSGKELPFWTCPNECDGGHDQASYITYNALQTSKDSLLHSALAGGRSGLMSRRARTFTPA
jgi:hypothetical protein